MAQLTTKQVRAEVERCFRKHSEGVVIPILALRNIYGAGEQAAVEGRSVEEAVIAALKANHTPPPPPPAVRPPPPPDNRWYGEKYERDLDVKEIAVRLRQAIKDWDFPGLKVKVKIDRYSMGQSLDVTITELPAGLQLVNPLYFKPDHNRGYDVPRYSPQLAAIRDHLDHLRRMWNHDGSDSQTDHFDVNYYGQTGTSHALTDVHEEASRLRYLPAEMREVALRKLDQAGQDRLVLALSAVDGWVEWDYHSYTTELERLTAIASPPAAPSTTTAA